MISMDTKQEIIRRYFRENDTERKIAHDMQINRKTVKKYLQEYLHAEKVSREENDPEQLHCIDQFYISFG